MGFDVLSFALGKAAGKNAGGSSETVVFVEQTLGFEYSEGFGAYYAGFNTSPFSLVDGQEYIVVWDGIENKRTAFAFTNPRDGTSCVALGNPLVTGGEANEDKFAVVEDKTNDNAYFFSLETSAEHTVKIYQKANGGGGDSGDTSKEYSIQEGSFAPTSKQMTVSHGGNKIPDIIIVSTSNVPTANILYLAYGFSQAMLDKLGGGYLSKVRGLAPTGGAMVMSTNVGIDKVSSTDMYSTYGGIRNVTDKTFTVGGTSAMGYLDVGKSYSYVAIFGLT